MNAPTKAYELTFDKRQHYLYAHVKADFITEKIALDYRTEVAARCAELKCDRLLIDRDIPDVLPPGSFYFVAERWEQMIRGVKIAYVNPYPENADQFGFGILVGTNRGGNAAVFDNVPDAEKWLLQGIAK